MIVRRQARRPCPDIVLIVAVAPVHVLSNAHGKVIEHEPVDRAGEAKGALVEILGVDTAARQGGDAVALAVPVCGAGILSRRYAGIQERGSCKNSCVFHGSSPLARFW